MNESSNTYPNLSNTFVTERHTIAQVYTTAKNTARCHSIPNQPCPNSNIRIVPYPFREPNYFVQSSIGAMKKAIAYLLVGSNVCSLVARTPGILLWQRATRGKWHVNTTT